MISLYAESLHLITRVYIHIHHGSQAATALFYLKQTILGDISRGICWQLMHNILIPQCQISQAIPKLCFVNLIYTNMRCHQQDLSYCTLCLYEVDCYMGYILLSQSAWF